MFDRIGAKRHLPASTSRQPAQPADVSHINGQHSRLASHSFQSIGIRPLSDAATEANPVVQPAKKSAKKKAAKKKAAKKKAAKKAKAKLKRQPFTSQTQKAIPVKAGQHRRHIISSHHMMKAIEKFLEHHKNTGEAQKLIALQGDPQDLHNRLNNNHANLIPGPGPENSAIGMFTNRTGSLLDQGAFDSGTAKEHATLLSNVTGFQQDMQKKLTQPAVQAMETDDTLKGSADERKDFAKDLQDSTDFDWPEGANPKLFPDWSKAYLDMLHVQEDPSKHTADSFSKVIKNFEKLPNPVKSKKK
jgi:hypothetical protein